MEDLISNRILFQTFGNWNNKHHGVGLLVTLGGRDGCTSSRKGPASTPAMTLMIY